ncbi:DUF349 domain-containing protein [Brevibacterium litoralis]|uniref:DUF349 domain-containing protein n=1 Tax=Brevibacterium litoralis TaxID=3138935 RepID=UPI0032EC5996
MSDESTTGTPKPGPVPKPSALPRPPAPGPRPGAPAPSGAAPAPAPTQASVPAVPARDRSAEITAAVAFGRVAEDATVYVKVGEDERAVGQYPDASEADALEYYARKYLDLVDAADLLEERLTVGSNGEAVRQSAQKEREALAEAHVVGDLNSLAERLSDIEARAKELSIAQQKELQAAREAGLQARTAVVEEAEAIVATDPARIQWKTSGARMAELFDRWKHLQSTTPRLPRATDQELWGRFSKARNTFDRHRREFFAGLDKRNAEGKRIKEKLVAEAEALSGSTEWRDTAAKYRDLMDRWKAAPRAGRKDDDALWARFRAAQDVFFHARQKENEVIDAEYAKNLVVKEELLAKAQALLPISDPDAAKEALRVIQDAWEEAGKVPRGDVGRMEGGLRAVEKALAEAEEAKWKRTDPEKQARATGMLAQLQDSLAELEEQVAAAKASGDAKKLAKAEQELETKRTWMETLSRTAEDLS